MFSPKSFPLKNQQKLVVVSAEPCEAQNIINFLNEVAGETDYLTFGKNEFWLSVDEEEMFLHSVASENLHLVLSGRIDEKIVASLTILRGERPRLAHAGELGISVLKKYWGLGIGRILMNCAISEAKRMGFRKINLKVREDNGNAIKLYESLGFTHEGLSPMAYQVNGKFYGNLGMGLAL